MIVKKELKVSKLENNTGQIDGLPKNPRFIKDKNFKKLVKSITDDPEFMDVRELLVIPHPDKKGKFVVFGGNMRLRGVIELGWTDVPCKIYPADTKPKKLRSHAIKDNIAFGEDDWSDLANEWDDVELEDFGMNIVSMRAKNTAEDDNYDIPKDIKIDVKELISGKNKEYEYINPCNHYFVITCLYWQKCSNCGLVQPTQIRNN